MTHSQNFQCFSLRKMWTGHEYSTYRQTDRQTGGMRDMVILIYPPPPTSFAEGILMDTKTFNRIMHIALILLHAIRFTICTLKLAKVLTPWLCVNILHNLWFTKQRVAVFGASNTVGWYVMLQIVAGNSHCCYLKQNKKHYHGNLS